MQTTPLSSQINRISKLIEFYIVFIFKSFFFSSNRNMSSQSHLFSIYNNQWITEFAFYYLALFGSLGIVLNLIGIVVFSRKTFADMSMGFYYIVSACVNNITLVMQALLMMPFFYSENMLVWSHVHCITLSYLNRIFNQLSAWLEMMITIDRLMYILYQRRFGFLKNKKWLAAIILGLVVFISVVNWQMTDFTLIKKQQVSLTKDIYCFV